ncbi:MAG: hypothetical protein ABI091_18560 [Ferruginibacter sp.]
MNSKHKKNNLIAISLCAIGCILIFNACTSRYLKGPAIKHWANWKVEFKEGTTDAEKIDALLAVNKYVLDSTHELKLPIKFEFYNSLVMKNFGVMRFGYSSIHGGESSSGAVGAVKPVGPRPHHELISRFILNIRIVSDSDFKSLAKGIKPVAFK